MPVQVEQQNTDSINEAAENPFVQNLTTMNTRKLFPVAFRETRQLVDNTISKLGTWAEMRSEPSLFLFFFFYSFPFIILKSLFPETDFFHSLILFVFFIFIPRGYFRLRLLIHISHLHLVSPRLLHSVIPEEYKIDQDKASWHFRWCVYSSYIWLCFQQTAPFSNSLLYIGTFAGYCEIKISLNSP